MLQKDFESLKYHHHHFFDINKIKYINFWSVIFKSGKNLENPNYIA